MNHGSHFSDGVVELSGADDHLHLEDVAFGDAALHQTLQHLLLVQPGTPARATSRKIRSDYQRPTTQIFPAGLNGLAAAVV